MRIRKSLLLLVVLVAWILAWRGPLWRDRLVMAWTTLREAPAASDVSIGHAYVLGSEWVRFPVPRRADALRVLTNAAVRRPLPPPDYSRVRPGLHYQIEYRLVDEEGGVLRETTCYFRAKIVQYLIPDAPEPVTTSHFSDPDLVPATSRRLRIPLERIPQTVRHIHLRLAAADPEIEEVVVRLAGHAERRDYDDPNLWLRLSRWRKQRLCRAVIYPPELLSLQQRREVLRWQWLPVAPFGIEGHDYERRALFSKNELQGVELEADYTPEGVLLRPGMRHIVRLPAFSGKVTIEMRPVEPAILASLRISAGVSEPRQGPAEPPNQVSIQWFDISHELRARRGLSIRRFPASELSRDDSASTEIPVEGGWLEVTSTEPVSIRLFWRDDATRGDPIEFTPEPRIVRTYPCREQELRFDLEHLDGELTPLRLNARQMLLESAVPGVAGRLRWTFVDRDGGVLRSEVVALPVETTEFDWGSFRDPHARISDPIELFWQVPPEAKQLVVAGIDGHPLVDVAIRPIRLPRQVKVSTRGLAGLDPPETPPVRAWFPLRPQSHRELLKYQKTTIVHLGVRPPEIHADVLAGNFRWEDFPPEGDWSGRYLLLPQIQDGEVRDEALASVFFELPLGQNASVQVRSETDQPVDLSCALLADEEEATRLRVEFDGVSVRELSGAKMQTTVTIPEVRAGRHALRVDGPESARAFINHTERPGSARYIKRTGIELGDTAKTFRIHKVSRDPELLMLDFFFVDSRADSGVIMVKAELQEVGASRMPARSPLSPLLAWKSTSWEFYIEPPEAILPRGYVLGTSSQQVAVGRRCFLWLGENVGPGDHALRIETDMDGPAYVVLSRVIPGQFPRRRVHRVR